MIPSNDVQRMGTKLKDILSIPTPRAFLLLTSLILGISTQLERDRVLDRT